MRVAGVALARAEVLAARVAELAVAAGAPEPGDRDPRPDGDVRLGPGGLDDPDALVAGDERQRRLGLPVAVGRVDVGVAEPARLETDQHLLGARLRRGEVLDRERRAERVDDRGLHASGPRTKIRPGTGR